MLNQKDSEIFYYIKNADKSEKVSIYRRFMARQKGFEPPTLRLGEAPEGHF